VSCITPHVTLNPKTPKPQNPSVIQELSEYYINS
jgi:hypothetical protein